MDSREPITHTKSLLLLSLAPAPLGAIITANTHLLPMNEHTMSIEQLIKGRHTREIRILFIPFGDSALIAHGHRQYAFG
jgi:hypothetical protein